MRSATLLIIPFILISAPSPSNAAMQSDDANAQVKVTFHDLDLQREGDARTLLGRIRRAAMEACGASSESAPEYRRITLKSKCYADGVSAAVSNINAPRLTELYDRSLPTTLANR